MVCYTIAVCKNKVGAQTIKHTQTAVWLGNDKWSKTTQSWNEKKLQFVEAT